MAARAIGAGLLGTSTGDDLGVAETRPIIVAVTKHMTMPVKTTSMTCIACPPFGECSAFTIFGAKIARADDVEIITSGSDDTTERACRDGNAMQSGGLTRSFNCFFR
jgi:hypothetical protein